MKIWFVNLAAALALNGASAQVFSPESFQFSLLGAIMGGSVGGDYHCGHYHWSGENAAIGAGVGLLAGTLIGEVRRQQYSNAPYSYPPPASGYHHGYNYAPDHAYSVSRPNYAVGGALLGAASGALIGEGANGKPGQGAAIGAAAGLVLGGISEHHARQREQPAPANEVQPLPGARTSVWQAAPRSFQQIGDAPRVPDAPTF
jgi:uncharacterized protein YcfJ